MALDVLRLASATRKAHVMAVAADESVLGSVQLADAGEYSFNGYFRTDHHELIDHIVATRSAKELVDGVEVYKAPLARVASDHFPVLVKIHSRLTK